MMGGTYFNKCQKCITAATYYDDRPYQIQSIYLKSLNCTEKLLKVEFREVNHPKASINICVADHDQRIDVALGKQAKNNIELLTGGESDFFKRCELKGVSDHVVVGYHDSLL